MHFGDRASEILTYGIQATGLLATPCLTVLAYRSWAKLRGSEFPRWRSVLGVTSIVATFFNWLTFVSAFVFIVLRFRIQFDLDVWLYAEDLMLVIGLALAFALRRPSRVQVLLADLFMILLLATSVIFD